MFVATRHSKKIHRVNRRILSNIFLPRQNFVAATCRTCFVRHVAATKFCSGDKILSNRPPNVEVFITGDLSLQSSNLQRFVAFCVPAFKFLGIKSSDLSLFLYQNIDNSFIINEIIYSVFDSVQRDPRDCC